MSSALIALVLFLAPLMSMSGGANIPTPEISGHRGTMVGAPESTMAAAKYAAKHGVDWIEMDVQWTKKSADGKRHMVIMHDWTIDRTTNGTGAVKDITLEDIRKLDAGSWFGKEWDGEKVPTFQELIKFCKDNNIKLNAEIKTTEYITTAMARQYIKALEDGGMLERTVMSSANRKTIRTVQKVYPKMKTALISTGNPGKRVIRSYGKNFMPTWQNFSERNVESVGKAGVRIFIWPVRNKAEFDKAYETQASVIVVDDPGAVKGWRS